jgi:hypothetical protein
MDFSKQFDTAKPLATHTNKWVGSAPEVLDDSIEEGKAEQFAAEALDGKEILIFGYSIRKGQDKQNGQPGEFMVITVVPAETKTVSVLVTGAEIIMEKLRQVPENGWPVKATIKKVKSKKSGKNYFDVI